MRYIPPFHVLLRRAQVTGAGDTRRVSLTYEDFLDVIRRVLSHIEVDEKWYVEVNEDVGLGIKSGIIQSARQHFVDHGYFEGRLPSRLVVDEAFYLQRNPEVASEVHEGRIASAQTHFDQDGYKEGRLPFSLGM